MNRASHLRRLSDETFDAVVVGGGIIGTGCVRDLATRGLRVALVEADDFGQGTTARSTRLIHGGLRYLEHGDVALVRESLRERERLLRHAPHLVRPLRFVVPAFPGDRRPVLVLRAGLALYDLLSFDRSLPGHAGLSADGVKHLLPALDAADGLRGGACYFDAQIEMPERLCWENVLSAARHGAAVANHCRVTGLLRRQGGRVAGVEARDALNGTSLSVRAEVVVNATGPWADRALRELLGLPPVTPERLRLTKGVHLVVPRFTDDAVLLTARSDRRVFFAVPWRGLSVIGTTDTDFTGDPAAAAADERDVAYLRDETRHRFPDIDLDTIYYTWAGVRALVRERSRAGMPTSQVSRRDKVHDHAADGVPGLLTVLGGKITAYRAVAEQVGTKVVRILGRGGPSHTKDEPLPGWAEVKGTDEGNVVLRTHGAFARDVLALAGADPSLGERVSPDGPELLAQVVYAALAEMAVTLGDALLRRTGVGFNVRQGLDGLEEAARVMGRELGWNDARRRAETEAYRREIEPMRRCACL